MNFRGIKRIGAVGLLFCSLFFISCGSKEDSIEKIEGIKINSGSITKNEGDTFSNYNLQEGKYVKVENKDTVGLYDSKSNNYIFRREGKYFSFYEGKEKELDQLSNNDTSMMLSPGGKYLSFFRQNDEGIYIPNVILTESGEGVKFESKVGFSWRDLLWLDEKTLMYYGVSDDRINGIFTYDIETGREELFYKLDGGVQFIKAINDGVIFLQETIDDKRVLKEINISTKEVKEISSDIIEMTDIIKKGDCYYLLGKKINSAYSVFKLEGSSIKRLVYDFPASIKVEKGLSLDEQGNILFIGIEKNTEGVRVYKYSEDGSVSRFSEEGKEYSFINNMYR